jgi:hypothetical protein
MDGLFADWLLWASLVAQFLLMVMGAVLALADEWVKKHRTLVLSAFILLGVAGMLFSAKQAVNASRDSTALSDIVTGGDSWGYVEITQPANTPANCRLLFVVNDGKKYPLRNVSLILVQNNGYMQYRVGDIAPNDTAQVPNGVLCPTVGVEHDYFLDISANNGHVNETLQLKPTPSGGWDWTAQVRKPKIVNGQFEIIKTIP